MFYSDALRNKSVCQKLRSYFLAMAKLTATQKKREAAKKQQYYQQQLLLEGEAGKAERLGKRRKRQSNLPKDARAETRADAKARMATLRAN